MVLTLGATFHNISGFQNKLLRARLPGKTSAQVSHLLKRLRSHGLIKKIGRTYKYYLTALGKQVLATGLKLKELIVIPQLAQAPCH
jgi:DNA-binding HxlR family transcriptional regulator